MKSVAVRIPIDTVKRAAALQEHVSATQPGTITPTTAHVIRTAVELGLRQLEEQAREVARG